MKPKLFEKISLPKFIGRYGVLAVDTFSTLIFFMLMGASWVLATTGSIFALVKIWHWQESWKVKDRFRRYLHRSTWFILAVLSIYFLITLALSITQTPEEVQVNENVAALEEAITVSRIATVQSLTREQEMLLGQNSSLAERMMTLNQWSDAFKPLQAQMNANLERLGVIAGELNRIRSEQVAENKAQTETEQEESKKIMKFQPVKPIGAQSLMGRVVPPSMVNVSIILLFTLVGIALEITMALSSLPAETVEKITGGTAALPTVTHPAATETPKYTLTVSDGAEEVEFEPYPDETLGENLQLDAVFEKQLREDYVDYKQRLSEKSEELTQSLLEEEVDAPYTENDPDGLTKAPNERKRYSIDRILKYIDIACQDNGEFLYHNQIGGISNADCKSICDYLRSLNFRGKPVVAFKTDSTALYTELGRENLKKFVALQCNDGGGV